MPNTQLLQNLLYSNTSEIYLRAGSMNQYVTALQETLHDLGYDRELMWDVYGADGYYGQSVVNALRTFAGRQRISSNGMTVTPSLLSALLQKHGELRPAGETVPSPWQPSPEPQPERPQQPQPDELRISDRGDKVVVSNGHQEVAFIKRDQGLAYYGSQTIQQAIDRNRQVMLSLGLTPSALNVMKSVAENEGKLDSINSYDRAFLSFGIFQWTLGVGDGTGELPALLFKLKQNFPAEFNRYFGAYGLDLSADTTESHGHFVLNGQKIDRAGEKERFRSPEWAFRFWLAGQDEKMQAEEIAHALARLKSFYWNRRYTINGFTLSEIITSEYGVALMLDHHVNRPAYVQPSIEQAMRQTGLTNPTFWGTQEEWQVLQAYLDVRASYATGSASPMTKAHDRGAVTKKYLDQGVISAQRSSFHYSAQMVS